MSRGSPRYRSDVQWTTRWTEHPRDAERGCWTTTATGLPWHLLIHDQSDHWTLSVVDGRKYVGDEMVVCAADNQYDDDGAPRPMRYTDWRDACEIVTTIYWHLYTMERPDVTDTTGLVFVADRRASDA